MARSLVSIDRVRALAASRGATLPIRRSISAPPREPRVVSSIAEVLLLAGGIRPRGFRAELGRSLLDLPVDGQRRLLDLWCDQVARMTEHFGWGQVGFRVLIDGQALAPRPDHSETTRVAPTVQRDAGAYRGTGGVIRDASASLDASSYVLVCNAFQMLVHPLAGLVERLLACDADLSFAAERCGGAGGIFLVRGSCMEQIPPVGFVDLKEQAIPLIAKRHRVRVAAASDEQSALPVRTLPEYIAALRHRHSTSGQAGSVGFAIVEAGAEVGADARLHDSVVLRGGRVGAGTVVAGSLVTGRGVVGMGHRVIDAVVGGYR